VTVEHLVAEGQAWGLAHAADLATETLATVLDTVRAEPPHERAHPGLDQQIEGFTSNLLAGREAGLP
jgi:serine/threonine-protein kinase HipA